MPGTYNVTLVARNAYGSDTQMLSLTVADLQYPAYRILLYGEVGKPFSYALQVAGTAPIGGYWKSQVVLIYLQVYLSMRQT